MRSEHPWMRWILACLFAIIAALPAFAAAADPAPVRPRPRPRPLIGAIRWDAWQDDGDVRKAMEQTLGPDHWRDRIPFFSLVPAANTISFGNGNTQASMDREIAYAKEAGLDYWAFDIYPADYGMSNGLKLYLASSHKADLHFALNLQGGWLAREEWAGQVARYVGYFRDESYQKVQGNRPLVYLFDAKAMLGTRFADWPAAKTAFGQLREAAVAAGLGQPYLVIQGWDPPADRSVAESLGADAIGAYASGCPGAATPYANFAVRVRGMWERQKAACTGSVGVVPLASAGWDPRPRREHPVPWTTYPGNDYTLAPAAQELSAHVLDALNWAAGNPDLVPANTILIYAWNEHDEGGWLCPTLKADGSIDTSRIEAVREARRQFEAGRGGTGRK